MKLSAILSLVSVAGAARLEARDCPGNNCNRAVTGTRPGLLPFASRSADCASFLLTTVTPAPTTITLTLNVEPSVFIKRAAPLVGRQVTVTASSIPTYAANCVDGAAYASACSCFGMTGSTITGPTPTVTETVTVDVCPDEPELDW